MKAYEIVDGMIDTLDIYLESEQTEEDKENYEYIMKVLTKELENKSSNILKYIRNLTLEVNMLSQEEERLEKLRKSKENKIKKIKNYLVNVLIKLDKSKVETDLGIMGLQKSTSVGIQNIELLPKKYLNKKVEITPNKRMLSEVLKQGKKVKGAMLCENYSLQIR